MSETTMQTMSAVRVRRFGLAVNLVAIVAIVLVTYIVHPELIYRVIRSFFLGALAIVPFMFFFSRNDAMEEPMRADPIRNLLLALNLAAVALVTVLLLIGAPYEKYSWLLVVVGGWTGNMCAWLWTHRRGFGA